MLWLFTMTMYYGLVFAGIYGSEFHVAKNFIGLLALIVGAVMTITYLRKTNQGETG